MIVPACNRLQIVEKGCASKGLRHIPATIHVDRLAGDVWVGSEHDRDGSDFMHMAESTHGNHLGLDCRNIFDHVGFDSKPELWRSM